MTHMVSDAASVDSVDPLLAEEPKHDPNLRVGPLQLGLGASVFLRDGEDTFRIRGDVSRSRRDPDVPAELVVLGTFASENHQTRTFEFADGKWEEVTDVEWVHHKKKSLWQKLNPKRLQFGASQLAFSLTVAFFVGAGVERLGVFHAVQEWLASFAG